MIIIWEKCKDKKKGKKMKKVKNNTQAPKEVKSANTN